MDAGNYNVEFDSDEEDGRATGSDAEMSKRERLLQISTVIDGLASQFRESECCQHLCCYQYAILDIVNARRLLPVRR